MEMADMGDSKSPGKIHAGSSPVFPIRTEKFLLLPIRQVIRYMILIMYTLVRIQYGQDVG